MGDWEVMQATFGCWLGILFTDNRQRECWGAPAQPSSRNLFPGFRAVLFFSSALLLEMWCQ